VRAALEQGNEQALAARRAMAGPASAVAGGESAADRAHTDSGESPDLSRLLHDDLHNDHGNAVRLITLHGRDLRYCYPFKKWLVWDGQRWAVDSGGQAVKIGKETMLEFLRRAVAAGDEKSEKFAKTSLDDKRIHSMLASAECELPIEVGQLDTQPDLLNFTNGTLCLRTSTLRPHEREDFITRLVHYPYSPAASAPTFLRFLARTMGGHPDASEAEFQRADRMVAYLQKAFGYSLTGSTSEKVVFFLHGSGSNGKTTLLSLFQELLQEYSTLLQVDTLMASRENNNSQADLADLRGIRYAMTSETEEGQRLAEGKLKRITQGMGRIKAVRKYENPVQFDESHKLWMDCNHKPNIKGSDNAIWNRLHLIPFTTVIPDHEVDRSLRGKLLAEAEGVLAWAVEGARRWYAEGLGRPAEIVEAVQEYRHDQDQVGRFIEECCTTIPTARANASRLYAAYVSWTEAAHEGTLTKTNFGKQMTRLDFTRGHGHSGDYYEGVGLLVKGDRDGEP